MARKSIALVVEGVGRQTPASGSSKGLAWHYGHSSLNGTVTDSYEWVGGHGSQAGLVDIPSSIGTEVDPFEVSISGASFTFQLHKSTLANAMWMASTAPPSGYLGSAISETGTSVQISSNVVTWGASNDGTVIWVGDEAILLGSFNSSTGEFDSCTRGYYGTRASTQPAGMSVYKRNPKREKRLAKLIEHNHDTSTTTQKWQGFVDDFDADSPVITVRVNELLAVVKNGVVNRKAANLRRWHNISERPRKAKGAVTLADDTDHARHVEKESETSAHWVALQAGEGEDGRLYYAKWNSDVATLQDNGSASAGSSPALGSPLPDVEDRRGERPSRIYEVFVVDRLRDDKGGVSVANARSSTRNLAPYPFHPVAISMGLFTSGYDDGASSANGDYDVFGWHWGLGMPIEWFAASDISTLLGRTAHSQIDQMVLGWDGEEVNVWEVAQNALRCRGLFIGSDSQGRITFARLKLANIGDKSAADTINPIPPVLKWRPAEGEGIDQIRGRIGETPWDDGQPYQANTLGDTALLNPPDSLRAGLFNEVRAFTLDLPYLQPVDEERESGDLISITAFRGQGAPRVTVRGNEADYAIGDIVQIGDPQLVGSWFVDPDNNEVTPDGSARWYGQVVGIHRQTKSSAVDLTVLMTNWFVGKFARFRAPSGQVASVSSNVYTLTSGTFSGDDDADTFNVGDKVELWRPDGVRRSGSAASPDVQEITSIGTDSLTLDAAFSTSAVAGDIIRLAQLDDSDGYPENGHAGVSVDGISITDDLAYVFLADTAETINPNDDDAHIYALGQI